MAAGVRKTPIIFIDTSTSWIGYRDCLINCDHMIIADCEYEWNCIDGDCWESPTASVVEFFDSCVEDPGVQVVNVSRNDLISSKVIVEYTSTFTIYHGSDRRTVVTFDSTPVVNRSMIYTESSPVLSLVNILKTLDSWKLKQVTVVNL
nr:p17 [Blackcurrant leafroll-associated virus 1]